MMSQILEYLAKIYTIGYLYGFIAWYIFHFSRMKEIMISGVKSWVDLFVQIIWEGYVLIRFLKLLPLSLIILHKLSNNYIICISFWWNLCSHYLCRPALSNFNYINILYAMKLYKSVDLALVLMFSIWAELPHQKILYC